LVGSPPRILSVRKTNQQAFTDVMERVPISHQTGKNGSREGDEDVVVTGEDVSSFSRSVLTG
jgi:hypothetical protein